MEQEEKLYDEVEIVREFSCIGDRVSGGCGCCDCQNKMLVD